MLTANQPREVVITFEDLSRFHAFKNESINIFPGFQFEAVPDNEKHQLIVHPKPDKKCLTNADIMDELKKRKDSWRYVAEEMQPFVST